MKRKLINLMLISFAVLIIFISYNNFITKDDIITREINYIVKPDDTLWDIAAKLNSSNEDIRKVIWRIKKENNIDGHIYPGQRIVVQVKIQN